ncbi:hypothetical protein U1Q18_051807, partial [Sarracenia purpurea var. burkii]
TFATNLGRYLRVITRVGTRNLPNNGRSSRVYGAGTRHGMARNGGIFSISNVTVAGMQNTEQNVAIPTQDGSNQRLRSVFQPPWRVQLRCKQNDNQVDMAHQRCDKMDELRRNANSKYETRPGVTRQIGRDLEMAKRRCPVRARSRYTVFMRGLVIEMNDAGHSVADESAAAPPLSRRLPSWPIIKTPPTYTRFRDRRVRIQRSSHTHSLLHTSAHTILILVLLPSRLQLVIYYAIIPRATKGTKWPHTRLAGVACCVRPLITVYSDRQTPDRPSLRRFPPLLAERDIAEYRYRQQVLAGGIRDVYVSQARASFYC